MTIEEMERLMERYRSACDDEDSRAHIAVYRDLATQAVLILPALLAVVKAAKELDEALTDAGPGWHIADEYASRLYVALKPFAERQG